MVRPKYGNPRQQALLFIRPKNGEVPKVWRAEGETNPMEPTHQALLWDGFERTCDCPNNHVHCHSLKEVHTSEAASADSSQSERFQYRLAMGNSFAG